MEFDRLVVSFLVDEVVGGFFISVPPGHIACVYDRGRGVLPRIWGPGLHLKIPFWQVAKLFNAQVLEYSITKNFDFSKNKEALGDEPIRTNTKDGDGISIEGSVLFRVDRENAPELWENIGENVVSKVVRPFSRSRISSVFSELTLSQIKTQRSAIENVVKQDLSQHFRDRGLDCEGFLLSEVKVTRSHGKEEVVIKENSKEKLEKSLSQDSAQE
jgi:regulator of protease activity HflC (stomatin/prohibitin superfamily)